MKKKLYLFLLVLLTLFQSGIAQKNNTTIEKVQQYYRKYSIEKIIASIPKDFYLSSEELWLEGFVLAENNKPSVKSGLVYIDLINANDSKILSTIKSKVKSGRFNAAFTIPNETTNGTYIVRAYTNYQQNLLLPAFEKEIFIINPSQELKRDQFLQLYSTEIVVAPEGGELIANIPTRVAVFSGLTSSAGEKKAGVYNSNNELITKFILNERGLGMFYLKPTPDQSYYILIDEIKKQLPSINKEGMGIQVFNNQYSNEVRINLQSTHNHDESNKTTVGILAVAGGEVKYAAEATFNEIKKIQLSIEKSELKTGSNTIVIFDSNGTIITERSIYLPSKELIIKSNIKANQVFKNREKVEMTIDLSNQFKENFTGEGSIAAIDINYRPGAQSTYYQNVASEFVDFWPEQAFPKMNEDHFYKDLDLIMFGAKSTLKNFEIESEKKLISPERYLSVNGTVDLGDYKPLKNDTLRLQLLIPSEKIVYETILKDNDFSIPIFDIVDTEYMYAYISNRSKTKIDATIRFTNSYQQEFKSKSSLKPVDELTFNTILAYTAKASIKAQIDSTYKIYDTYKIGESQTLESLGYNNLLFEKADIKIDLDDYFVFPTMEDVFVEIVPTAAVKRTKGAKSIQLFSQESNKSLGRNPLILLDDYPVIDVNWLMELNPENIQKIEILSSIRNRAVFGPAGEYGIILITSKQPKYKEFLTPHLFPFMAFNPSKVFVNYEHNSDKQKQIPDLRSLLYYNPQVKFNQGKATIQFYTSDNKGDYIIQINGLTENGELISHQVPFKVE